MRLYEKRFGNVISEENADELVIELLDEPSARWIVAGLYPELADGPLSVNHAARGITPR